MMRGAVGGVLSGAAASAAVPAAERDTIATAVTITVRKSCRPAIPSSSVKEAGLGLEFPGRGRQTWDGLAVWRARGLAGRLGADRARRGASGALYPQAALAGLNPCPRVRVRGERRARSVDGQVPRNVTL